MTIIQNPLTSSSPLGGEDKGEGRLGYLKIGNLDLFGIWLLGFSL